VIEVTQLVKDTIVKLARKDIEQLGRRAAANCVVYDVIDLLKEFKRTPSEILLGKKERAILEDAVPNCRYICNVPIEWTEAESEIRLRNHGDD